MPDVKVPQQTGTISVARNGDDPTVRTVSGGVVQVAEQDLDHFLAVVDGAQLVQDKSGK